MHSNTIPPRTGYLMPIGGAEDKVAARVVLAKFISLAGGRDARIVVIPSASEIPDEISLIYRTVFTQLGVDDITIVDIRTREQAQDAAFLQAINQATGIFLTGGDQAKLTALIGNSPVSRSMAARLNEGAIVAGTSAGASAMSRTMIASGQSGTVPSQSLVEFGEGLGLVPGAIIDQHFRQRQRIGRLITTVLLYPSLIGIGIDEDTALLIGPDQQGEVIGSGSVTIIDASRMEHTDIHHIPQHQLVSVMGMVVHILTQGYRYDLAAHLPLSSVLPT